MNHISNITVIGGGVLGSQIAFHTAYKGFDVVIYDIRAESYNEIINRLYILKDTYIQKEGISEEQTEAIFNHISFVYDLREAVKNADLVIESIPENIEIKKEFFLNLAQVASEKTIFATNSSTMLPSHLMEYTGRPNKFLALHFANVLLSHNIVEIMGHPKTDERIYPILVKFANELGMVPVEIKKEQPGYILNSLLMPLLSAASELLMKGIADIESIDKTWKIATGSPAGPFEIYDTIGINTIYNVARNGDMKSKLFAHYLKENYIKTGKDKFYNNPKNETNI